MDEAGLDYPVLIMKDRLSPQKYGGFSALLLPRGEGDFRSNFFHKYITLHF
jgi:hypothetical protein